MATRLGVITVTDGGIQVSYCTDGGGIKSQSGTSFNGCDLESLEEATRILGAWMQLKSSDPVRECHRVSNADQFDAMIRDMIDEYAAGFDPLGESKS